MLHKLETAAVIYEGISRYACFLMISFAESTVDNHQFAVGLYGILTLGGMYGHMTVDDMAVGPFHLKGVKYVVAYLLVVTQFEVISFLFLVNILVLKEIAFECGHLRLVEQWTVLAAPQIQEIVDGVIAQFCRCVVGESRAYELSRLLHQFATAVFLAGIELNLFKCAVGIQRHRGMEKKVAVVYGIHASMAKDI